MATVAPAAIPAAAYIVKVILCDAIQYKAKDRESVYRACMYNSVSIDTQLDLWCRL